MKLRPVFFLFAAAAVAGVFAAVSAPALAAEPVSIVNLPDRVSHSLNGKWAVIVDPYETGFYDYRWKTYDRADGERVRGGFALDQQPRNESDLVEYAFDDRETLYVPRDWNSQDDRLFYYEGTVWYRRRFDLPAAADAGEGAPPVRRFVHFGGANYRADVYLNGRKLGMHEGGFTPFAFEITDLVKPTGNSLVVRVDNKRRADAVPALNTDWWNYGGLTRDVSLVELPQTFVSDTFVRLARGAGDRVLVSLELNGPQRAGQAARVLIPELGVAHTLTTDAEGRASGEFAVEGLQRWEPGQPRHYEVTVETAGDRVTERIGFRTVETRGADILVNGRPVFLRGICIHEENPLRGGRAATPEDARLLLGWAQELGCNFVRLAHYTHNEHTVRLADELGLMVWEEIPVYWTIAWDSPEALASARRQLAEMIQRDRNRASTIVWSVGNEAPISEPRTRFMTQLVDDARALDGTRLVSAAMEVHRDPANPDVRLVDDPFGAHTDLVSFNQYVGWYDGLPERARTIEWRIAYDKPVVISEFGAGALEGMHGGEGTRFSEEFQAAVYRETTAMLERIPQYRGMTPWILADFRSPRRLLPGVQDGWNRKGVIGETGARKQAFYVLQDYYRKKAEGSSE